MMWKRRSRIDDFSVIGSLSRPARRTWWMRLLRGEKDPIDLGSTIASVLLFSFGMMIAIAGLCIAVFRR